ncbi:hypothetical protein [Microseira wollei]|nr:hypothetical protein [Microseira wollei]
MPSKKPGFLKKPGFWCETPLIRSISELLGTRINLGAIAIALQIKVLP